MKKLLLILALVSMVSGAKYTFVGDSRLALDTAVCNEFQRTLNDGSTFVNRSVSGKGWSYFDLVVASTTTHWLEFYTNVDTADYVVLQLGVNNTWDTLAPGFAGAYTSDLIEYRYLDKFVNIVKSIGKIPILVEMQSAFSTYYDSDTTHLVNQLDRIIRRNEMRREYCASNNILYVETFDTFALSNGRPDSAYYNSDMLHFNRDGNLLFGQLLANSSVPTSIKTYTNKKVLIDGITTYTTAKKRLYSLNLMTITDSLFWYNVKPNGSNLLLYVNDTLLKKNIDEFGSYSRKGTLRFQYSNPITKIELLASSTLTDTSVSVFDSCNVLHVYPLTEGESNALNYIDVANNDTAFLTTSGRFTTYYSATQPVNDSLRLYKFATLTNRSLTTTGVGMSGLTKFTIDYWIWIYDRTWWTQQSNILMSIGSSTSTTLRVFNASNFSVTIGATGTNITMPLAQCTTAITAKKWHKITMSFDLTQADQADKYKVVVDSTDISSLFARAGTIGASLPTFTDSLNVLGWYTLSNFWPNGAAFRDIRFFDDAVTVSEAIADYKIQTGDYTVSSSFDPSAEMGIDTLTFVCSADGAVTYQWFLDGVEMPGETDSVLVIYADSAFYSTTHTLYCLVNGSIVSDSWTIREQTSNWFFFWRRR